jgi:predicted RNase H-like HicB family nuclease
MRYAIVIEKLESNYSAYVPDLPWMRGDRCND